MKRIAPAFVEAQIQSLLTRYPELEGDEELRSDMIEAETDAHELLALLVRKKVEADAYATGIKSYEATLSARRQRFERRSEAAKELMFKIMDAAGLQKAELAEATLSVRAGAPKVIITDETALPDQYVKVERNPKKTEIKDALKRGEKFEGAELSNGEPSLAIRMN